jgi:hypothetical protein
MSDDPLADAREALAEITALLRRHFWTKLRGLYLFGSLAAGGFRPGRSDLDLVAVLDSDVREGEDLRALESLHAAFAAEHPAWIGRVEVGYVSQAVLQTFGDIPTGRIAVISPGEPLNDKEAGWDWVLNWHSVCADGEALLGPPPLELGPAVTAAAYRRAVEAQLKEWRSRVGDRWIAYVPAHQGYIVATVCRALYALTTGEQTTKENAVAWAMERFPEWSTFIDEAFSWYKDDLAGPHQNTMRFVDYAVTEADGLQQ